MFTLKVIEQAGYLVSDKTSTYGGTDMTQLYAFAHLFPDGECPWVCRDLLFDLAKMHGWEVEVRKVDDTKVNNG